MTEGIIVTDFISRFLTQRSSRLYFQEMTPCTHLVLKLIRSDKTVSNSGILPKKIFSFLQRFSYCVTRSKANTLLILSFPLDRPYSFGPRNLLVVCDAVVFAHALSVFWRHFPLL
jgi:hypothetical protein